MAWRLHAARFESQKGSGNKRAMKKIVKSGKIPGLIGYVKGEPVAWCSMSPRDSFPRLERSRVLKPIDDKAVWSITCFFIARPYRNQGLSVAMLEGAVRYAACKGARIVEGYPFAPRKTHMPDAFMWCGLEGAFKRAGFKEACRRSPTRPIMRITTTRKR
jgi:GNAT superfamily N-acetyltransferase